MHQSWTNSVCQIAKHENIMLHQHPACLSFSLPHPGSAAAGHQCHSFLLLLYNQLSSPKLEPDCRLWFRVTFQLSADPSWPVFWPVCLESDLFFCLVSTSKWLVSVHLNSETVMLEGKPAHWGNSCYMVCCYGSSLQVVSHQWR